MTQLPPVDLLLDAATFVLTRTALTTDDLRRELLISEAETRRLVGLLKRWRILSPGVGGRPCVGLIGPAHMATVLATIKSHGGVVPDKHPLAALTHPGLTDQRRRVLDLVAEGLTSDEIAARLYVTRDTVKCHVTRLCRLLGARNKIHLVTVAHRCGLLPNPYDAPVDGPTGTAPGPVHYVPESGKDSSE